jgi:putative phage-type endonuclease
MDSELFELRRSGVGGSDVSAILGLNPWRGPFDVWLEKTGEVDQFGENQAMMRGRLFEPAIANWYSEVTEQAIEPGELIRKDDWMIANPDFFVLADGGRDFGLEIKTARSARKWGDGGTDSVPVYYALQCHWYMACTGMPRWDLAVYLTSFDEFRRYVLPRDEAVVSALTERVGQWWERHVIGGERPPIQNASTAANSWLQETFSASNGEVRDASSDEAELAEQLRVLKDKIKELSTAKKDIETTLKAAIGENRGLQGDFGRILWSNSNGSTRVDVKRLKAEQPEIYAEFSLAGAPTRTFRANFSE